MAPHVLKISCQGEFHRIRLELPDADRPEEAFSIIDAAVRAAVKLPAASLRYCYKDADGDLCSLAPFTCDDVWRRTNHDSVTGVLVEAARGVPGPDSSSNTLVAQARQIKLAPSIPARSEGNQAVAVQNNVQGSLPMQGYVQESQAPVRAHARPLDPSNAANQASAQISPQARIHDGAKVGPGAVIEAGVVLHARCTVGPGAHIGSGSVVHACATVGQHTRVGSKSVIHAGSRVGARAQIGSMTEVHAGANVGDDAKVGDRCLVHSGVRIGANANIGECTLLHSGVRVGDYAMIEDHCLLHSGSGVAAHSRLRAASMLRAGQQA
eukprot:TRINITY_DN19242_c0_g2_i1.p1 TRINITY_DN19242_c0_g2~~TRINITY_DN19242_c0_g2_i1.p1  ORF type:complete len:324 (-),score=42.29 TRINITY_DN19242_c0_g2_i1:370-1341(-)